MLQVNTGRSDGKQLASVTSAFAGIAETGTLMLLSDPESPTTLNFLPEAHLVVLPSRMSAPTRRRGSGCAASSARA